MRAYKLFFILDLNSHLFWNVKRVSEGLIGCLGVFLCMESGVSATE